MEVTVANYQLITWVILCLVSLSLLMGAVFSILKNDFKSNHIKFIVFIGSIVLPIAGPVLYFFNKEKWKQK